MANGEAIKRKIDPYQMFCARCGEEFTQKQNIRTYEHNKEDTGPIRSHKIAMCCKSCQIILTRYKYLPI